MRLTFYMVAAALSIVSASGSQGNEPITAERKIEIRPIMENNRYRGVTATGIIEVPPPVVWKLITDYENDAKYFPNTRESRVVDKDGNRILVHKKMKFYFFSFNVDIEYKEDRECLKLYWNQVKGPFTLNSGTWTLEPFGGNRTLAVYAIRLDHPLMTRWLAEKLMKKNIPEMYRIINDWSVKMGDGNGASRRDPTQVLPEGNPGSLRVTGR